MQMSSLDLKFSLFLFSFFLLDIFSILIINFLLNSCTSFKVKSSQHPLEAVLALCLPGQITACTVSCLQADPTSNIPLSTARGPHNFQSGIPHLEIVARPSGITSARAHFGHRGITARVKR